TGSGHIGKFYFVDSPLNWTDAQRHCRDTYTDLASINSTAEMDTVLHTTNLPSGPAWIGLYRDCRESWRWSGGEVVTFTHWRSQLPCAALNAAGFWEERDCSEENFFVCESQALRSQPRATDRKREEPTRREFWDLSSRFLRERPRQDHQAHPKRGPRATPSSLSSRDGETQQYRLIRENKTFAAAQRHCRESCSDLPRVDSVGESEQIRTTAQGHAVWIALLQDGWEWSDGRRSGFRNWSLGEPSGGGALYTEIYLKDNVHNNNNNNNNNKRGGWNDAGANHSSPFFCYNGESSPDRLSQSPRQQLSELSLSQENPA
ncbi:MRC2 protein, partial [Atractosteus spatula]|nr:MRC2 protein [Atractosteus spatula]